MRFRSFAGWALVAVSILPWFLTRVISPYDTMGTDPHNIRPSIAWNILYCAIAASGLLIVAGVLLFADRSRVWNWKSLAGALIWALLLGTSVATAVWVQFQVINVLP
jgi:hypothetical protein